MKPDEETWRYIHTERGQLAETLAGLSAEQWATPSWCAGWSVQQATGHVVAAAEQTPLNFYRQLAAAGFRFHVFTDRDAKRLGALPPSELVSRLQARTSTTNHPPAPVLAMLGEVIVHGADIRRPLGSRQHAAGSGPRRHRQRLGPFKPAHRRQAPHRRGTPSGDRQRMVVRRWPDGAGPLLSLVLAMTGRTGAHATERRGPGGAGQPSLAG